jgi:hypothetical protein
MSFTENLDSFRDFGIFGGFWGVFGGFLGVLGWILDDAESTLFLWRPIPGDRK